MLRDRHRRLIQVTLEAAAPYGVALGGRNALAVHGLTRQTTKLIDVVTSRDTVPEAAAAVQAALRQAGYQANRQQQAPELENAWPGGRDTAAEWHVRKPEPHDHPPIGGIDKYQCPKCFDHDYLGLSRAPRSRDPVPTDLGPVLHPEDAAGQKVADLARSGRIRDYTATADLLDHYSPAELIGFARRLDPSLRRQDFAHLAQRLDELPEIALTAMGALEPRDVPRLRERFATWPRDTRQIRPGRSQRERTAPSRDLPGRQRPEHPEPDHPARHPRDLPELQPARPGSVTEARARERSDVDRVIAPRAREREADRDGPEIER